MQEIGLTVLFSQRSPLYNYTVYIKGTIEVRKGEGRKQTLWLSNIRDWTRIKTAAQLLKGP